MPLENAHYLEKLKSRRKESHVYRRYQLLGLQIADILADRPHKALYIKLVKERGSEELLGLAKRIAEQKHIEKKGAYFMACLPKKSQIPSTKSQTISKSQMRKKKVSV
ncbi:MAG: hypothetical protein HYW65_04895 [Candidatus Liptonbacteria bacterium]|nr:hypothetical protein [Candidatus Liptonbacteria bacterium]